jgi:uncharacterized protein YunC (DUF1805 family)
VALGIKVELGSAPLLLIKAEKGFVMCGFLNVAAADSIGEVAAKVSGVNSFEDVLEARIVEATGKAEELGITKGLTGREALEKMF